MNMKINQLKVGVILSYVSRVITIIVGILYTPVMIRLLGQNEFGIYNIAASTIAYLGILNFGFGSAYIRFYARYKVEEAKDQIAVLNAMFLIVFSLLGLLVVILGIVLALNVEVIFGTSLSFEELQTTRLLLIILIFNLAFSFPAIVFNTYIQANEHFVFQNLLLIVTQVTSPLVNLPILLAGYGSVGMVLATTIIFSLAECVTIYYCLWKMNMRFRFKDFDWALMKEMTVFSSFIFINLIVDQVNNNVDKTILGRYGGTIPVAVYSIGANLYSYYIVISMTISNVFIPRIHRMETLGASNREMTDLFTRVGRIQLMILSMVMSGFIFFGRPFIGFWAGPAYYESYYVGVLLMLAASIPLIQNIGVEIQRAKNLHKFRSLIYLMIALGNIAISIPLAKQFGAVGSALGTALAMIIGNGVVMNWYYHRKVGININYFWSEIARYIPGLVLPIMYGVLVVQFVDLYQIFNFLLAGIGYVLIFIGSAWLMGMNDYEKHLVRNPFN